MTTITASTTIGIDLNPAIYTSPVVIGAGVTVSNTGYPYAVYRHSGATTFFVIDNNGAINAGTGIGVYLAPGGSVTNAATASITGNAFGVKISGGAGTVVNDGSIAYGVRLSSGGSVTNGASAHITGHIYVSGGAGTVVNDGSIAVSNGFDNAGVVLDSGGSVTNAASAHITGSIYISGGVGTVVNDGSTMGVRLGPGGSVTNAASAHITGGIHGVYVFGGPGIVVNDGTISGYNSVLSPSDGVDLSSGGTLTNAGSIIGYGTAVAFGGTGSNLLVLDPGFGFSGIVAGGTSSSNTLELASTASAGTVTGLGSQFIRFHSIAFDPGAQWFASGIQRGLAGPITGFAVGDAIELTGVTATGSSFVGGILTLDLVGGGSATLNLPGTFTSASDFEVTNVAAGADVTVVCFLAGTRIATPRGEVPVERLAVGDRVEVLLGSHSEPVIWLGYRTVDCARHPEPCKVWPVRITAGAFGPGRPARNLWLSPDHAVFVNDVLIPVKYLINGASIAQVPRDTITYYHVELSRHSVLLAEGLPTESYLDTGNRSNFVNGNGPIAIYPDFASRVWDADGCAPLVVTGPELAATRRWVNGLASIRMTRDAIAA